MYGNKKLLTMVACILIFALAFVPVRRANAFVPAIPAAVYYAIAAVGTASGLYAMNKESMDYYISDYWNKSSEYVRKQWEYAAVMATAGKIIVDGTLSETVIDYLDDNFTAGQNSKSESIEIPLENVSSEGQYTRIGQVSIVDTGQTSTFNGGPGGQPYTMPLYSLYTSVPGIYNSAGANHQKYGIPGTVTIFITDILSDRYKISWRVGMYSNGVLTYYISPAGYILKSGLDGVAVGSKEYTYTGDPGGFGAALKDPPEVEIPCPPVPPAEWPDRWADDLTDGMTGQGGQVIEGPMDWFKDKDTGKIIYFPPGDPPPEYDPKKHEKLVPPVPPVYDPVHPAPGEPGPATPEPAREPATEPCPYCPDNPHPLSDPCPNPYCPNNPEPVSPPVPASPGQPVEPCPYCPPNPDPNADPCPNPYCPNNPDPVSPPYPDTPPTKDDRYIDTEPLRKLPQIFTRKFPFSLPWDFYNSFKQFEGSTWDGKIDVNVESVLADFNLTIDLSMFDRIRNVMIKIELMLFDVGLILATRRLLGGGV